MFRFVCCTSAKRPDSRGPQAGEWRRRQVQSASEDWLLSCGETKVRREENVGRTRGDACPLPPQREVNRILLQAYLGVERVDGFPQKSALLITGCKVRRQAAVPESAEGTICRRGGGKSPKIEGQSEHAAPNTTDAILARLTDEERTCSFRAQRCQREERHVHTEASHFSQPAAWD